MGKHSDEKFQCDQCSQETGICSNKRFHLKCYRRHYYIYRKNLSDVPEITITKKKVKIDLT